VAIIDVSNASQLASALQVAKGGDVIRLASGDYGAVNISGLQFASDLTITSKDPGNAAVFDTINVKLSSNIVFDHVNIDFTPTATTYAHSSAVMIDQSTGVTFKNGAIEGGPSVNGVPISASALDSYGNIIGLPAGRAVTISKSSDVSIENADISLFDRGIVLSKSDHIVIRDSEIHDLRRSGIVGGSSDLVIENNHFSDSNPWRWGLSGGDHADFIALWTDAGQTTPYSNVIIRDNVMERGDGAPILGLWLGGSASAPFKNVVIADNAIIGTNHQGIMLTAVVGGSVSHNLLVQTTAGATSGPGILIREGTVNVDVATNLTWFIQDQTGGKNVIHDNTAVQSASTTQPGYYTTAFADALDGDATADSLYATFLNSYKAAAGVIAAPAPTAPTAPIADGSSSVVAPPATGDLHLVGTSVSNQLVGGSGNDILDGRGGTDTLIGGAGNDTYIVPNSLSKIVESANGGIDTVIAKGDHTLAANVENLTIDVGNGWGGLGNELNNVIVGNASGNWLEGRAGNDTLRGDGGADRLFGGDGADLLAGGAGADTLTGGAGADKFQFKAGGGTDRVLDFSYAQGDRVLLDPGQAYIAKQAGADVVLSLNTGDTLTLANVTLSSLHTGWVVTG
jgi:Ca2+-binding RTX toxin-like protein